MTTTTNTLQFDGVNFTACVKHLDAGGVISAGKRIGQDNYYLNLIQHFKEAFNYKPVWKCREDQSEVIITKK